MNFQLGGLGTFDGAGSFAATFLLFLLADLRWFSLRIVERAGLGRSLRNFRQSFETIDFGPQSFIFLLELLHQVQQLIDQRRPLLRCDLDATNLQRFLRPCHTP